MAKKKTSLVDAAKKLTDRDNEGGGSKSSSSSKASTTKHPPARKAPAKKTPAKKETTAKKTPAKKAPAKKAPAGKAPAKSEPAKNATASGKSAKRQEIIGEINEIAEGLDDASLALLLEQAQVVRYKGQIEEFNRQLNTAATRAAQARREASRPDYSVAIERNEDDFFIIQMDSARIFFNIQEMRELTKICHRAKDEYAGARLLFRWFDKERSDLLADTGINTERSPYLYELYDLIVNTYKVRS
ncbi:MAG: hypothetical protein ACLFP4_03770 [Spirochaetales bacterium]